MKRKAVDNDWTHAVNLNGKNKTGHSNIYHGTLQERPDAYLRNSHYHDNKRGGNDDDIGKKD